MALTTVCYEMHGYPRETWESSLYKAERKLMVAWSDRHALMTELLTAGGHVYPYNALGAVCKRVSAEPFKGKQSQGGETDESSYEKAIVTANYTTPVSDTPQWDDIYGYISQSLEPMGEFITLSHEGFKWGAQDGPAIKPAESPGMMMRGLKYIFSRYYLTSVPAALLTYQNTTNLGEISATLLGLDFTPEQLLFSTFNLTRDSDGTWTLTYIFLVKETGWNKFYHSDSDAYINMYRGDQPFKPYTPTEWTL